MQNLAILVGLLVLAAFAIHHVNSSYEKKRSKDEGPSSDDLIDQAWDDFGGDEPAPLARRRVDRLATSVKISALTHKSAVLRYAVMASRAERHDLLPLLAERAEALDAGCGETRTLRALSEALTGSDPQQALEAITNAQSAVAGCSKCSSSIESQLLAQELAVAADTLEDRFAQEGTNREPAATTVNSAHGSLTVRKFASG
jgi:hypothetical protein